MSAKSIMFVLASMVPEDFLFMGMREQLDLLTINPENKEVKDKLKALCLMVISREASQGNPDKAMDIVEEMERTEKLSKVFKTPS